MSDFDSSKRLRYDIAMHVRSDQRGTVGSAVSLLILTMLLLASMSFGFWAYMGRQDYKDRSDKKAAVAVKKAEEALTIKLNQNFAEREKSPTEQYTSPTDFGGVNIVYPRTWSAYVVENPNSATPVDGYFHPNFVPSAQSTTAFALRVQIAEGEYSNSLRQFDSAIKSGKLKASPYRPKLVPSTLGTRLEGEIPGGKHTGVLIYLPVRDKTLKIWTESTDYSGDLDTYVLEHLIFNP